MRCGRCGRRSRCATRFPELGIQGRIGVNTGEVVTGTEERLATGDAVNVAARLEQAAQPGEILIGDETLRLVRDAVEVEPVEPLELKGRPSRCPAYRLLVACTAMRLRATSPTRRWSAARRELRRLARRVRPGGRRSARASCSPSSGAAGVGKSRLAAEFLGSLDDALVVRGRCLPYGEGITYWPVVEVLKQLAATPSRSRSPRRRSARCSATSSR